MESPKASARMEAGWSEERAVRIIVSFCRFARRKGLNCGTKETLDSLRALQTVPRLDLDTLHCLLRAVLCSSKEEWDFFDVLFAEYCQNHEPVREKQAKNTEKARRQPVGESTRRDGLRSLVSGNHHRELETVDKADFVTGASTIEQLKRIDFATMSPDNLAQLEKLSHRLLRRLSWQVSMKLQPKKDPGQVDLRRTIRRNLSRGGDLIELSHKKRRRQRARLVIFLDVSDSMNPYSVFLLKFAYVLRRYGPRVTPFIFSTRLVEVGDVLKARLWSDALEILSGMTTGWSGGTRIGRCLSEFNRLYSAKLLSRNTVFVILSDGWDTEPLDLLLTELDHVKSRVKQLIWLNPLLGLKDYQPVTRAMSAALPYIDVFAPAHNLESLLQLERHLRPIT